MVRGNWQKRVETAQARRNEAKQKKQRSEEKRIFKAMAQEVLSLLDRHNDSIQRRASKSIGNTGNGQNSNWDLHLWTDSLPAESPPFLDIVDAPTEGGGKSARRARSASIEDEKSAADKKGGRKGKQGNKKAHPRSKEASSDPTTENNFQPHLCRSQFFYGKCLDPQKGGKKGGCRCLHYSSDKFKTLAEILNRRNKSTTLKDAENACADATYQDDATETDPGSMDMVYYLKIPIDGILGVTSGGSTETTTKISDAITEKLASNSCSIASIVYLVISTPSRDILLFDRHQEGVVNPEFNGVYTSNLDEVATGDDESPDIVRAEHLPISILEHILAYVEAETVAAADQVCKAWNREIRNASPNLWRHLLEQRSWPFPQDTPTASNTGEIMHDSSLEVTAQRLRSEFIGHYSVLRDMRAIQSALSGLLTKKFPEEREMTFQAFSTRRSAPQTPNTCVALEIWGPNRVLAGYSNDCTLRLFQAIPKSHGSSNASNLQEKICRETVCMCIDPYKKKKKKKCFMEAVGLDEDVVGCLCSVSDDTNDYKTPHILVVISRDDLLVVDSSVASGHLPEPEEGAIRVIDIEQAVLNFVLSLDHVDHRLLRLNDFLALGGNMDDVEVIVSQTMAACGYGRFMLEVAISIPFPEEDDQNDVQDGHGDLLLLDRKLFLFSSSLEAIVWMGDSNPPSEPPRPRLEDMSLVSYRTLAPGGGTRTACTVSAVSNTYAPIIMSCEIESSGQIDASQTLGSLDWARQEREIEDTWVTRIEGNRPIVVSPTDIVIGTTLTRQPDHNNAEREYKAIVTFYSRFPATRSEEHEAKSKLVVGENCTIDRMVGFRDDYIILLCRSFAETGLAAVDGGGGHWGGEMNRISRVYAITIHIPSRREIERLCMYEDYGFNRLHLAVAGDTVGCGVWLKGIIMTGSDIRSVGAGESKSPAILEDSTPMKAPKKKGKKRQSKGGKKDGFARGMSLRG